MILSKSISVNRLGIVTVKLLVVSRGNVKLLMHEIKNMDLGGGARP